MINDSSSMLKMWNMTNVTVAGLLTLKHVTSIYYYYYSFYHFLFIWVIIKDNRLIIDNYCGFLYFRVESNFTKFANCGVLSKMDIQKVGNG